MSINSLTNAALARRSDFEPAGATPDSYRGISDAAGLQPERVPPASPPTGAASTSNATNTALQTLTTYIPTEILTLYVSAVAALGATKVASQNSHDLRPWLPFVCFVIATPLVVWLTFASKLKSSGKDIPLHPVKWPLWEMIAATLAYAAWAFALPDTPFAMFSDWYSTGLAGFLVILVSWGLGAQGPLMQRSLPT